MKKNIKYIFAALAALLTLSCQKEKDNFVPETVMQAPVFRAAIADGEAKASIDKKGKLTWGARDSIGVFYSTYHHLYVFDGAEGATEGAFKPTEIQDFVAATPLDVDAIFAVYPYRSELWSFTTSYYDNEGNYTGYDKEVGEIDGTQILLDGTLIVELPSYQPYNSRYKVSPTANVMVAATTGSNDHMLNFRNVCGYLSIPIKGTGTITNITLWGHRAEPLSGYFYVNAKPDAAPEVLGTNRYNDYVSLSLPSPITLSEKSATEFCLAVPPTTFEDGFSIQVETADGQYLSFDTGARRTIERNTFYTMEPIEVNKSEYVTYVDPDSGSTVLTFNECWWGPVHQVEMQYKESFGVRYCTLIPLDSPGIWGDDQGCTFNFIWYLDKYDDYGCQVIDVPAQYMGFDYNGWDTKPESEAEAPLYAADEYYCYYSMGQVDCTADEFYERYKTGYRRSYYNPSSGKFSFTLKHFVPGVGSYGTMEDAAYLAGPNYKNYDPGYVSVSDAYPGESEAYFRVGSGIELVRYAVAPGSLETEDRQNMALDIMYDRIGYSVVDSFSGDGDYKYAYVHLGELASGEYTIVAVAYTATGDIPGYMTDWFTVYDPLPELPIYTKYTYADFAAEYAPASQEELIGKTFNMYATDFFTDAINNEYIGKVTISDSEVPDEGPDDNGLMDEFVTITGLSGSAAAEYGFDDSLTFDLYAGYLYLTENTTLDGSMDVYNLLESGSCYKAAWLAYFIPVLDGYYAFVCDERYYESYNWTGLAYYNNGFRSALCNIILVDPEKDDNGMAPAPAARLSKQVNLEIKSAVNAVREKGRPNAPTLRPRR
ncbi:MAG: hypothetical protein J5669_08840 [Bacteroidales bacterium]|nr:hypothetical protein [Bacteroidales bacterium]